MKIRPRILAPQSLQTYDSEKAQDQDDVKDESLVGNCSLAGHWVILCVSL
jgi:hypothetical protein